jgi:hypothetical protein
MINKHGNIGVGVVRMMAFLAESCQGDQTHEQQSVLKIEKSTAEVHLVWHDYLHSY